MHGKDIRLEAVGITYPNGFRAVEPTDLEIRAGEFFSILGPSGCGKTTILRTISGFVNPSEGRVLIGGEDMAGRNPDQRPTALIFQNLALFPLMSVRDNVAFGLEARGVSRRERHARAEELLDLVALGDQAAKKPTELSGGQRQRVAIARALAVEPSVLLLDEPLSALDLKLRQHMRAELRAIQEKTGVTFLYITHDQSEALAMSDRIAVMNKGRIEQVGPCDEVYSDPRTAFAASFVGEVNMFPGTIKSVIPDMALVETALGTFTARNPRGLKVGDATYLFVRPETMRPAPQPGDNIVPVRFERRDLEGAFVTLHMRAENGMELAAQLSNDGGALNPAAITQLGFTPEAAIALPEGQLARTGREEMAAQ
ncbi:ABC transporter ATP-binding protein [Thioclava atlantica]|uniref:ABC transporter nucleotide binding/ATPase protein n=1 Tax=Thioclava atlantica TaxID=1317124 RepID=A0A085TV13_9RHOB|nr:ABC transporter ATP-binding protein [Thioclava atlantica]KFE34560.1 ABC transporter nucleotide binding/ATPase protein [Thioclava atlantica]